MLFNSFGPFGSFGWLWYIFQPWSGVDVNVDYISDLVVPWGCLWWYELELYYPSKVQALLSLYRFPLTERAEICSQRDTKTCLSRCTSSHGQPINVNIISNELINPRAASVAIYTWRRTKIANQLGNNMFLLKTWSYIDTRIPGGATSNMGLPPILVGDINISCLTLTSRKERRD
jgi:hypothetical protein